MTGLHRHWFWCLVMGAVVCAGCDESILRGIDRTDAGPDAGVDAGLDAGFDAGSDAGVDAGPLVQPDAGALSACPCPSTQICVAQQCRDKGPLATPTFPACTDPPCMNVYNNCPMTLWTHAISTIPIDDGTVRELPPNAQFQYAGYGPFGGGRIYAYYQQPSVLQNTSAPVSPYNQFIEMTITSGPAVSGGWTQNYDISYVDFLTLPVSVQAESGCPATICGGQFADWSEKLQECPTALLNVANGVGTCAGSYNYCITPDGTTTYDDVMSYCSKMQVAHGYPGSDVYGGVFPSEPSSNVGFWDGVAAWNRGTLAGDADAGDYYQTEPYNDYARMIHVDLNCLVYAFSTDDHQNQSGFTQCSSPVLDVVWCPYQEVGSTEVSGP